MTTATPAAGLGNPQAAPTPPRKRNAPDPGKRALARTLRYALLLAGVVFVFIPVYVLFVTSFKGVGDASPARAWLLPTTWSMENWASAWEQLAPAIGRTVSMVVPSTIISAVLGCLNGFVLSRWRFPGADIVFTLILFGMFLPYQAVMIPLLELVLALQIPNGVPSLILLHVVFGIPITTLIFRNYFETVPHELMEAAKVDGAGMLRTFWSVALPVAIPGFVVVLIWQFTSAWNDFLFAVFFSTPNNGPVTLVLNNIANGALLTNYGVSMAGALLASLPTLLVYVILSKYFIAGLMSGSVKG
ncbi:carbohydrate ABC transporter permease [Brachybacterium muris]|uniref:carbohydrate ABC transporter permease n=1 Tax=Brachybacterium muris TaxID=219301 RepID=UPI00223B84A5|nr:carbohydrate ABC transporter permease [Brachybacterium muris]MCT1996835.1 carbohydrate ABC transporter permease [Brachybacterium muris]MCT2297134.1 carbohydrate ABC transporter permease [Brachybacterium muris]